MNADHKIKTNVIVVTSITFEQILLNYNQYNILVILHSIVEYILYSISIIYVYCLITINRQGK